MYQTQAVLQTIKTLKSMQLDGKTMEAAVQQLHRKEHVAFDDLWPALMTILQVSEKEAMYLTKKWI